MERMKTLVCGELVKPYLCGSRREVLEGPPYFVIVSRLLNLLRDFHDMSCSGRRIVERFGRRMKVKSQNLYGAKKYMQRSNHQIARS